MTMKSDIEDLILNGELSESLILVRLTTTTDDLGNATAHSPKRIPVTGLVIPVSGKVRNQMPQGTVFEGAMVGYFLPSYTWFETDYEVSEGDEIKWDDISFRIEKILKKPVAEGAVTHIKAFMRRIA